ncbi:DUF3592 domain-containing protein [Luteolibacter sp. LG18]|uniref:DUF3592 domain-containing protein n=1 Tax=Luteolibacter sp. LG18 TaxID=2819286 RepID=UPI0030C70558
MSPLLSQMAYGFGSVNWGLLFPLFFIGFFVAIGVMLIELGLPERTRAPGAPKAMNPRVAILWLAGGLFATTGSVLVIGGMMPDLYAVFAARDWPEVPARITSIGTVIEGRGKHAHLEIDVRYIYRFEGHDFESDRYELIRGSIFTDGAKKAAVRAHPVGSTVTCLVNPRKPWMAVVERGIGGAVAYWTLCLAISGGGIFLLRFLWKHRKSLERVVR